MDQAPACRPHRRHLRRDLPLVLHRQAPARARARPPGAAAPALHRRLASLPAQSRHAARGRRPHAIPHRQVRQPRALAAARRAHHRDRRHGRAGIPSRSADPHAQYAQCPPPDPLRRPEGRAGRRRRGAVRRLFLQRRRHRRRQGAGQARRKTAASTATRCWRCWRARPAREVLAADQMARNAGIQGVPSFALQGHVLFSGAVPAEEMVQAFRHAWDILKNRAA